MESALIYLRNKKLLYLSSFLFIALFLSCRKDCCLKSIDDCNYDSLIICDSASFDLERFVIRHDSSYIGGGSSVAIKVVPGKGAISWVANNSVYKVNGDDYYLTLGNYSDTSWIGLEPWFYLREAIAIKFDPSVQGEQLLMSESTFDKDTNKLYGVYDRYIDDYHDAAWEIDEGRDNYIAILRVDRVNKIVEGEYQLYFTMIEQSTIKGRRYSEEIIFKCGRFVAKIYE